MTDVQSQLNAIERRRRWKLVLRIGGVLLVAVGAMLLPVPAAEFTKRDLNAFSRIADLGTFLWPGVTWIVIGLLILMASLLIREDLQE